MNAGERTIEWLYKHQLQVDAEWSVRTERGFTWWPCQHAQRVEITGDVKGPDGATGQCVVIRTEVLRDLDLTDGAAVAINGLIQAGAYTMSGLVYDAAMRRLDLCSSVVVHEDIREWLQLLMSIAVVLQIAEAQPMADTLVKYDGIGASEATSGHPTNGMRTSSDEMATIDRSVIIPSGRGPCAWTAKEFADVESRYMQKPPALFSMSDWTGVNVEFPYGDFSSLCEVVANKPHLAYGNGLRVTQSFPMSKSSDAEGARFALLMNATELAGNPVGYGFGSYFYREGLLRFSTFFPNFIHKPGLLPNLCTSPQPSAHGPCPSNLSARTGPAIHSTSDIAQRGGRSLVRRRPFSKRRRDAGDEDGPRASCWLSALRVYTDIMNTDRDRHADGQSKLEQALAAVQAGDLDSARRQFEELVMDDPHDPLVLYNLGLCYNEVGSYDAARRTLLSCLALDPGEANTYVALGLAEAKLGQMADAEAHLVQAVTLEPDNPYALRNLASVHAATGRLPQALEELLRVDTILHDDPPTVYGLGLVYRTLGRPMEATRSFQRCAALADLTYAEMARDQLREMAEQSFKSGGLRIDAVQFCYEALTRFDAMTEEAVQTTVNEIALLGRHGLDPHDAEKKHTLGSMEGRFSGLQLICFLYVGIERVAPGQDIGFDLSSEYDIACAWRKEPRA